MFDWCWTGIYNYQMRFQTNFTAGECQQYNGGQCVTLAAQCTDTGDRYLPQITVHPSKQANSSSMEIFHQKFRKFLCKVFDENSSLAVDIFKSTMILVVILSKWEDINKTNDSFHMLEGETEQKYQRRVKEQNPKKCWHSGWM